jgi:hypothetical protein
MGNPAPCAVYYGWDPFICQNVGSDILGPSTKYKISVDALDQSSPLGSCGLYVYIGYYKSGFAIISSEVLILIEGPNLPTEWTTYSSDIHTTPNDPDLASSTFFIRKYTGSNGWLVVDNIHVVAVPDGDANADGVVDVGDLGILAANYGKTSGATWADGDFNGDGVVDVGDLGILAANYGTGSSSACDFNADYAKMFGTSSDKAGSSNVDTDNTLCSEFGLSLIAGLALMGLMLMKLEV